MAIVDQVLYSAVCRLRSKYTRVVIRRCFICLVAVSRVVTETVESLRASSAGRGRHRRGYPDFDALEVQTSESKGQRHEQGYNRSTTKRWTISATLSSTHVLSWTRVGRAATLHGTSLSKERLRDVVIMIHKSIASGVPPFYSAVPA